MIPYAIDWSNSFVPAVTLWLNGLDPYTAVFFNAPWLLPLVAPFVILGDLGRILFLLCAVASFGFTAYRLGAKPIALAAFLLCPFVFNSLAWGNVEWLAILGLAIPGPVGLLLLAIKPQMSVCVILFWIIETWYKDRWSGLIKLLAFPAIVGILSLVLFGPWFVKMFSYQATLELSLFPWSIPIGVYLFIASLRYHSIYYAIAASPMFFPSVTPQVWLVAFLALASDAPAMVFSTFTYWLVVARSY